MDNAINYVGIDVSKNDFYACFNESSPGVKFNNNPLGIHSFIRHLGKNFFNKTNTEIGMESTASYHLLLCFKCSSLGFKTMVINPLMVKKQNQTSLRRVKNDPKDASLIRYCLTQGAGYEFKESCVKTKLPNVYQEIQGMLEQKAKELEKELKKHRAKEQQLLKTIPGVGPLTAAACLSEIQDIKRFKHPKQLTAYVGLDPRVHQSGISINGKGYISKRGNKILRTRLYNAASVAVLRPNLFQSFFQKKISEGKPYKVALIATMNKMVHVIHAVWTSGHPFEDRTSEPKPRLSS